MKKIFIIKLGSTFSDLANEKGDFEDWILKGLGDVCFEKDIVNVEHGEVLPKISECAGVLLSGSHSMVTEKPAFIDDMEIWLKKLEKYNVPTLGICFGHQLIAKVFGGDVYFRPQGVELGTVEIILEREAENDPLFSGMPERIYVHEAHSQSVVILPKGAVRLAKNKNDNNQAFRLGDFVWGVQFHPEYDPEITKTYIKKIAADIKLKSKDVDNLLKNVKETPEAFDILAKFTKLL